LETEGNPMETLLLSVDFEDWHQLVRRRVGVAGWQRKGPALARQTEALLALLDELGARATFFLLGMAVRSYPELVSAIAARGHELACHGDQHRPVHSQTPAQFAADLRAARASIQELTGVTPLGYRAPAFSITAACGWAFEVLATEGFVYDSSQHDSPRIRGRIVPTAGQPHRLLLDARGSAGGERAATDETPAGREHSHTAAAGLWEFPIAVAQMGAARLPVGGASYWGVLPTRLTLRGLAHAGPLAGLYLHPHELDPLPLRARLPHGAPAAQRGHARLRAAQRNLARRRAPRTLRTIAKHFRLITYGEAYAQLSDP
jgi:polysaccharide deacetylase family protein (PEP-CTERM system associated)